MDRPETISAADLGKLLGLSGRRVQQLAAEGVLPKTGRGRYEREACLLAFIRYQQGQMPGRLDLAQERAKLAAAQREKVQHDLLVARGQLMPVVEVTLAQQEASKLIYTALIGLPARLGAVADAGFNGRVKDTATTIVNQLIEDTQRAFQERARHYARVAGFGLFVAGGGERVDATATGG